MSTVTKEWLQKAISDYESARDELPFGLDDYQGKILASLRIALASLEAEAVSVTDDMAYSFHHAFSDSSLGADEVEEIKTGLRAAFASVTAPPAPVSVPDERYQHLSELYHAQEKRLFKLAQRIKGESFDKYSHSPSQAIDVLESAIFGEGAEEDSNSAMLQGADGNSTVIPDGWVACSERMPEEGDDMIVFTDDIVMSGVSYSKKKGFYLQALGYDDDEPVDNVTHWMPLPAAPQQEVK